MDIVLVWMLTSTLWWHIYHSTFQEFQQTLLHTFTTYIAGDRRVIALTCYLINFINKDDTALGSLNIIVRNLQQAAQDALYILAHIACFGKYSSIDNGERHIKKLCYGTGQKGLTCTCRAYHDYIALFYLNTILVYRLLQTLIVIVDRNCQMAFCLILSDDIFIKISLYLTRLWHLLHLKR